MLLCLSFNGLGEICRDNINHVSLVLVGAWYCSPCLRSIQKGPNHEFSAGFEVLVVTYSFLQIAIRCADTRKVMVIFNIDACLHLDEFF